MSVIERLVSLVAPHHCFICGQTGDLLCVWCRLDAFELLPSRCYSCYSATENSAVCQKCRHVSPLKHVWIRTEYEGAAKKLVQVYKFEQARSAALLLAQFMKEAMPYFSHDVLLIPIPTATSRIRQRGFDHAQLIAKSLNKNSGLQCSRALKRIGQAKQVGQRRAQRKAQLAGAFYATTSLAGKHVLLIDDVVTTGASLEAAARVCRRAGAKTVDALVFAQAK